MRHASDDRTKLAARENGRLARTLRAFAWRRARVAEDEVARLAAEGGGQYVILGAGLDTFAYATPRQGGCASSRSTRRQRSRGNSRSFAEAGITPASDVAFVTVDFDVESPLDALARQGWNPDVPTVFAWLGVTMYLEGESVERMLTELGRQKNAIVIFDYAISPELLGPIERLVFDEFAKRVASAGEPWISSFQPDELTARLLASGFAQVEDLGPDQLNAQYSATGPTGCAWVPSPTSFGHERRNC